MRRRFKDTGAPIYFFGDRFLVECPRCGRRADVVAEPGGLRAARATLSCASCGHLARWTRRVSTSRVQGTVLRVGGPVDWFFHLPVWLRTPCCGHELWAYSVAHLAFLEAYVGAELRERRPRPERGWANGSLASRLPQWMQRAKNRDEVLRCIHRLRERAGDSG